MGGDPILGSRILSLYESEDDTESELRAWTPHYAPRLRRTKGWKP
jgi:hypothetical protein